MSAAAPPFADVLDDNPEIIREPPWTPQPGPQERAIRASFIEQLLFGGLAAAVRRTFLLATMPAMSSPMAPTGAELFSAIPMQNWMRL